MLKINISSKKTYLNNFPLKCSVYSSIFLGKPLDGFENLVVNKVTPDIFVRPILFQQFHDFILHPGQMDLYPDPLHMVCKLVGPQIPKHLGFGCVVPTPSESEQIATRHHETQRNLCLVFMCASLCPAGEDVLP